MREGGLLGAQDVGWVWTRMFYICCGHVGCEGLALIEAMTYLESPQSQICCMVIYKVLSLKDGKDGPNLEMSRPDDIH